MKIKEKMENLKDSFKSVKIKLFLTLCFTILIIIIFLIGVNTFALEKFYLYSK